MENLTQPNIYYTLLEERSIYPQEVVDRWGSASHYWRDATYMDRELSLRHDMVCICLANLETLDPLETAQRLTSDIPTKRRRIEPQEGEGSGSGTGSSSSSRTSKISCLRENPPCEEEEYGEYRYLLIEGMPSEERLVNHIANRYGLPLPDHVFDLFDRKTKQWIEVKVTQKFLRGLEAYEDILDPLINSCLVWISPVTGEVRMRGREEPIAGAGKATDFILRRANFIVATTGREESGIYENKDAKDEIFNCNRFNQAREEWIKTWWDHRTLKPVRPLKEFPEDFRNKPFSYGSMASYIEDTSARMEPIMTLRAKVLPPILLSPLSTHLETDEEMVDMFFQNIDPLVLHESGKIVAEIKGMWVDMVEKSTFSFISKGDCVKKHPKVAESLGIGRKGTVRNDGFEELRQDDFEGYPKARYSPWMSEFIQLLAGPLETDLTYAEELSEIETPSVHPMGKEMQQIRSDFFKTFGRTRISEYCSLLKNFYSRLGGAYCERTQRGNHNKLSIFPLSSTGTDADGNKIRRITGVCVRGPHHAKQSTDRITLITIELVEKGAIGQKFTSIVKKANLVYCTDNKILIVRRNSILKQDPSYLAFVHNATYLSANFLGEIFLQSTTAGRDQSCMRAAACFIQGSGTWLMERVVESVLMAILGGSQEEGAFAIIRKIFMATLGKRRGDIPYSRDWKGLGDALNECLKDSAYALYWAQQMRETLLALSQV